MLISHNTTTVIDPAQRAEFVDRAFVISNHGAGGWIEGYRAPRACAIAVDIATLFDVFFAALDAIGVADSAVLDSSWRLDCSGKEIREPYCARQRLTHGIIKTMLHHGTLFACRDCVLLGLPCFRVDKVNRITLDMLPMHPSDRRNPKSMLALEYGKYAYLGRYSAPSDRDPQSRSGAVVSEGEPSRKKRKAEW